MRARLAAWLMCLMGVCSAHATGVTVSIFTPPAPASADSIVAGAQDAQFTPFNPRHIPTGGEFWLHLVADTGDIHAQTPVLAIRHGRQMQVQLFTLSAGAPLALLQAVQMAQYRGTLDTVFVLPQPAPATLYAYVAIRGRGTPLLSVQAAALTDVIARGAEHTRMIASTFGALLAMALAAFAVWFILKDALFILYALLVALQALYVAYLSGQGFDWPLLAFAEPLTSYAWNVPAALSGAVACLFVREIADLRRYWPRVYSWFGSFAALFVVLAFANLAQLLDLGPVVTRIGNVVFLASALLTLSAAFLAWRRGSRAAGWFLIAWVTLEAFTIATVLRLLATNDLDAEGLLFYGLPLSMVAAAILMALGVADRLREQRQALTEAERHAQTDPLTGVLNRRSFAERLDAACRRAQARSLPVTLLFIDLDHFKQINDTYGHRAGDECLRAVIAPIQTELRQSDVIGRYGGEEFIVILSSADEAAAHPIAQRILERVAGIRVEGFGPPIQLTCSIGVAASDKLGVWGEHLIAHADAAVYVAKRSGRNRVQLAVPIVEPLAI